MQSTSYRIRLSPEAELSVWFATERGAVVSYAVVLLAFHEGAWHTVRVYDNAHDRNEMHRHTFRGGKERAEVFHAGEFGEAMRSAREEVLGEYGTMVEAWRR